MAEPHSKDIEARLRAGVEAARSGEIAKARAILSKVVLEKPKSVQAWWYLGQVVEEPNQRIYCFKQVLNLDPTHAGARAKLGLQPWDKKRNAPAPPGASDSRSKSQRRILIFLTLLTLLVLIGGGGYIYLDTTGMLDQLLASPPTEMPPPTATTIQASPTSAAASLSTIPTWTPTVSPTPRPTEPPYTATPAFTPTFQPPTPESLPEASDAQVFDLAFGTEVIVIEPGEYFVMRFEAEPDFNLETVGALVFHAIPSDPEAEPSLELFLQEILDGGWQAYGVNWADNPIVNPGEFVSQDGTIVAALRNWGTETLTLSNAGFTLAALDASGAQVYYGLTRQEILQPGEATSTATPIGFDT